MDPIELAKEVRNVMENAKKSLSPDEILNVLFHRKVAPTMPELEWAINYLVCSGILCNVSVPR